MNSLICAVFVSMITNACELEADDKYRIAMVHYEKARQIAREKGSSSEQVRSLKKAHAEMQKIVLEYPGTNTANRILVDTRIGFSAKAVERKLSLLGVKAKIEQRGPNIKIKRSQDQDVAAYAVAELSSVYYELESQASELFSKVKAKFDFVDNSNESQNTSSPVDPMQTNTALIKDDGVDKRSEVDLAIKTLNTDENNKVSDIPASAASLTKPTLPNKLPIKKPRARSKELMAPSAITIGNKSNPALLAQLPVESTASLIRSEADKNPVNLVNLDDDGAVASAPDENAAEQIELEKIASSTSNSGSAVGTQDLNNNQSAQSKGNKNNEPDIAGENIASSELSQESELLDLEAENRLLRENIRTLKEQLQNSMGVDEVKLNVNLSNFYEPFLRYSILQSVSDDVDGWFDDSPLETYQSIDKSEISRMSGYSIAAGWRYKNYGLAYVYENHGERNKKDTGITTSIGSTDFTEDKFKTTVQLIELSKTWSLSKRVSAEIFGAIGEARREYILSKGLDGAGAWEVPGSIHTWEPASRVGVGLRHRVAESLHLSARFQASDYGRVALGGNALNLGENGFEHKANEISLGLEYAFGDQLKSNKAYESGYVSEQKFNRYVPYFRLATLRQINADVDDWFDDRPSGALAYIGSSSISTMKGVGFNLGIKRAPYFAAMNFENHGEQTYRINNYGTATGGGINTNYDIFKTTVRLIEFGRIWEREAGNYYEMFIALGEAQREWIETGGDDSAGDWRVKGSVRTREPAWRVGVGQSYKLLGPISIYGRLYYTDYGRVALGGNTTNSGEVGFEHKSTEASIGLEYKL